MQAVRVPWSGASFLAYLGGLTVLFSIVTLLGEQSTEHGSGAFVFWAFLLFAVLFALTVAARRTGHAVTAGLLSLSAVAAFVIFAGAVLNWFGWLADFDVPLHGFHLSFLALELLTIVAAAVAWSTLRFPPLVFAIATASWYFTADLLSSGGDWTAIVTIAFGLILLMAAVVVDPVPAFWLHLTAGLTIGGGLLSFFDDQDSTFDWIVIAAIGLAFIVIGSRLARSSWVVLGAFGLFESAIYFADKWSGVEEFSFPAFPLLPFFVYDEGSPGRDLHLWAGPLVLAVTGLVFMAIALAVAHRRREATPGAALL